MLRWVSVHQAVEDDVQALADHGPEQPDQRDQRDQERPGDEHRGQLFFARRLPVVLRNVGAGAVLTAVVIRSPSGG